MAAEDKTAHYDLVKYNPEDITTWDDFNENMDKIDDALDKIAEDAKAIPTTRVNLSEWKEFNGGTVEFDEDKYFPNFLYTVAKIPACTDMHLELYNDTGEDIPWWPTFELNLGQDDTALYKYVTLLFTDGFEAGAVINFELKQGMQGRYSLVYDGTTYSISSLDSSCWVQKYKEGYQVPLQDWSSNDTYSREKFLDSSALPPIKQSIGLMTNIEGVSKPDYRFKAKLYMNGEYVDYDLPCITLQMDNPRAGMGRFMGEFRIYSDPADWFNKLENGIVFAYIVDENGLPAKGDLWEQVRQNTDCKLYLGEGYSTYTVFPSFLYDVRGLTSQDLKYGVNHLLDDAELVPTEPYQYQTHFDSSVKHQAISFEPGMVLPIARYDGMLHFLNTSRYNVTINPRKIEGGGGGVDIKLLEKAAFNTGTRLYVDKSINAIADKEPQVTETPNCVGVDIMYAMADQIKAGDMLELEYAFGENFDMDGEDSFIKDLKLIYVGGDSWEEKSDKNNYKVTAVQVPEGYDTSRLQDVQAMFRISGDGWGDVQATLKTELITVVGPTYYGNVVYLDGDELKYYEDSVLQDTTKMTLYDYICLESEDLWERRELTAEGKLRYRIVELTEDEWRPMITCYINRENKDDELADGSPEHPVAYFSQVIDFMSRNLNVCMRYNNGEFVNMGVNSGSVYLDAAATVKVEALQRTLFMLKQARGDNMNQSGNYGVWIKSLSSITILDSEDSSASFKVGFIKTSYLDIRTETGSREINRVDITCCQFTGSATFSNFSPNTCIIEKCAYDISGDIYLPGAVYLNVQQTAFPQNASATFTMRYQTNGTLKLGQNNSPIDEIRLSIAAGETTPDFTFCGQDLGETNVPALRVINRGILKNLIINAREALTACAFPKVFYAPTGDTTIEKVTVLLPYNYSKNGTQALYGKIVATSHQSINPFELVSVDTSRDGKYDNCYLDIDSDVDAKITYNAPGVYKNVISSDYEEA